MALQAVDWSRARSSKENEATMIQDHNYRGWGYAAGEYQSQLGAVFSEIKTPTEKSIVTIALEEIMQGLGSQASLQSFTWSEPFQQLLESSEEDGLPKELQELRLCLQGRAEETIGLGEDVSQYWDNKAKKILREKAFALVQTGLRHLQTTTLTESSAQGVDWNLARLPNKEEEMMQGENYLTWGYAARIYQNQLGEILSQIATVEQKEMVNKVLEEVRQRLRSQNSLKPFKCSESLQQLLELQEKSRLSQALREFVLCVQGRSKDTPGLREKDFSAWKNNEKQILREKVLALVETGLTHLQTMTLPENTAAQTQEQALQLVRQEGNNLANVGEQWRRDEIVALAAVQSNGEALQYVHKDLLTGVGGSKIVHKAIRNNPKAILFLEERYVRPSRFLAQLIIVNGGIIEHVEGTKAFWQEVAGYVYQELESHLVKYPKKLLDTNYVLYYVRLVRLLVSKIEEVRSRDAIDPSVWKLLGKVTSSINKEMSQNVLFMQHLKEECAFIFELCYRDKWIEEWPELLSDAPILLYEALQTSLAEEIPIDFIGETIRSFPVIVSLLFENEDSLLTQECLTRIFFLIIRQAVFASKRVSERSFDACVEYVKKCVTIFSFIPEFFVKDPKHSILQNLLSGWGKLFPYLQSAWKDDEPKMLALVRSMGQIFSEAPWLREDQNLLRYCIQKCGFLLAGAPEDLRKDTQFIMKQVQTNPSIMWGADEQVRRSSEILLQAVRSNHIAFLGAGALLRQDKNLVKNVLMRINQKILRVAHRSLRDDREWVLQLLSEYPWALCGASASLLQDIDFLVDATKANGKVFALLSEAAQQEVLMRYPEAISGDFDRMTLMK